MTGRWNQDKKMGEEKQILPVGFGKDLPAVQTLNFSVGWRGRESNSFPIHAWR